jgi:hypothetical protein
VKEAEWTGHAMLMGRKSNAYRILVGQPEWRGPFGTRRCR